MNRTLFGLSMAPLMLPGCGGPAPEGNHLPAPRPPVASSGPVAGGNGNDAVVAIGMALEALRDRDPPAPIMKRDVFRFESASSEVRRAAARLPSASAGNAGREPGAD